DDDGADFDWAPVRIAHRDLAFRVRTEPRNLALLAERRQVFHQMMRHRDRHRHQLRRFVARKTEHQALVARALFLVESLALGNALRDIGRLWLDRGQNRAIVAVKAALGAVVTDSEGDVAGEVYEVGTCAAGNFSR